MQTQLTEHCEKKNQKIYFFFFPEKKLNFCKGRERRKNEKKKQKKSINSFPKHAPFAKKKFLFKKLSFFLAY